MSNDKKTKLPDQLRSLADWLDEYKKWYRCWQRNQGIETEDAEDGDSGPNPPGPPPPPPKPGG